MNIDAFIYGVPMGFDFIGSDSTCSNLFKSFYTGEENPPKLSIEIRSIQDKKYSYYNYLIYRSATGGGISDFNGRPGSFFGISLRFENAVCTNVHAIYHAFELAFQSKAKALLKPTANGFRYLISSFSEASIGEDVYMSVFNTLRESFGQQFERLSIESITSFPTSGGGCERVYLPAATDDDIIALLKKYGRVEVSPYFESAKIAMIEHECDRKIRDMKRQCEIGIDRATADCRAEITQLKKELSSSQSKYSETLHENEKLNNELTKLREENRKFDKNRNISHLLDQSSEPILKLAEIISTVKNDRRPENKKKPAPKGWSDIIKSRAALNILIIGVLMVMLFFVRSACSSSAKKFTPQTTVELTDTPPIYDQDDAVSDIDQTNVFKTSDDTYEPFDVKINVKNYNKGKLQTYKEYTVSAMNGFPDIKNVSWIVEGANILGDVNNNIIQIMTISERCGDSVCIKYLYRNQQIWERKIPI